MNDAASAALNVDAKVRFRSNQRRMITRIRERFAR